MLTIRHAKEKDIPRIQALYYQLVSEPKKYVKAPLADCRRVLKEINKNPNYSMLVAEENGEVVGTTFLAILPGFAHTTHSFAVIEYVVVDEKCRRTGIGKKLTEVCVAKAKEAGCYKVMLASSKFRKQAHKFYRAMGFEEDALSFRYYF
jgi:N-acetylglutamate synthase-like GNAT family acetyltransferase